MYSRHTLSLIVLISVAINLIECKPKEKTGPADNEPRIVPLRPMKTVGMPSDVEPIPKFYLVPHNSGAIAVRKVAVNNNNNNQKTGSTQSGGQKKKKCNHKHKGEEKAGGGGGNDGGEDEGGPGDDHEEGGDNGERRTPKSSRIYSENPRIKEFFDRFSIDLVEKADGYY